MNTPQTLVNMVNFLEHLQDKLQPEIEKVLNHHFFQRLSAGQLTKQQVQKFALDYNFYCQCFPQLLGYAAGKIEDDKTRMPIIKNLWEEHGEGDINKSHRQLYINFLKSLDISFERIQDSKPSNSTKKYINQLLTICKNGNFLDVLGVVGPGTEYFASKEFEIIYNALLEYPFSKDLDLEYWSIHIEVDDHHSSETLDAIKSFLTTEENKKRVFDSSLKAVELEVYFWNELNKYI